MASIFGVATLGRSWTCRNEKEDSFWRNTGRSLNVAMVVNDASMCALVWMSDGTRRSVYWGLGVGREAHESRSRIPHGHAVPQVRLPRRQGRAHHAHRHLLPLCLLPLHMDGPED